MHEAYPDSNAGIQKFIGVHETPKLVVFKVYIVKIF